MDEQGTFGAGGEAQHIEGERSSVLVVEDDAVSAMVVCRILEDIGYTAALASDGSEALRLLDEHHYRIVVSDWMMPTMDGVELCQRIRERKHSYTYFILLTAKNQRQDRLAAFEAGVDDMLSKPLDRDDLIARLRVGQRIIQMESELASVTGRLRAANANLEIASRRFEDLFQRLPVACFTIAADGLIHEWNREAEQSFDIEAHRAFMRPVEEVLGTASSSFWNSTVVESLFQGDAFEGSEWSLESSDGTLRHFVGSTYPFKGPTGEFIGVICANVDITERVRAEQRIEEQMMQLADMNRKLELLSITDGLTGLRNHRFFQDTLASVLNELPEQGRPVSLIILDVDSFKNFNDTFGHVAGDMVLKTAAGILKSVVEEPGLATRYGGEEFAIVLPDTDSADAIRIAEGLRAALEDHEWQFSKVTASFGVATTLLPGTKAKELTQAADAALYASKKAGRNRVTHSDWMKSQAA